jgi:hypothetical protein
MDIDRRTTLKVISGLLLTAPAAKSINKDTADLLSSGNLDDFYSTWIGENKTLPIEFLSNLGLTADLSDIRKVVKNDFLNSRLFIYRGLYLSQTEAALVAHAAYLQNVG